MKNKFLLLLIISFIGINLKYLKAQNNNVSLGPNYQNQIFYSMSAGEVANISNENWDIAFSTDLYSTTIRINEGKGTELYTYSLGDTSSWSNINNSATNTLGQPMYNSDLDWSVGAFDVNITSGFDYGWGVYNMSSHHVVGDSLFIIKTVNGNYKKLWIESKASGKYFFKYANLDGSNLQNQEVPASDFNSKNFIYFSLDQNNILDREPSSNDWDLTFTRYITPVQGIPYPVTGVFSNNNVEVAQVNGIASPITYTDYFSHVFSTNINTIGYDWKSYQGSYIIASDRCYFVRDLYGDVWRLIFTSFDGMSTGNIEFNTEKLEPSTSSQNLTSVHSFNIYPNPVNNQDATLLYDVDDNIKNMQIISSIGKVIFQNNISHNGFNSIKIPTSELESGLYLVLLNDQFNNTILTEKIIVY